MRFQTIALASVLVFTLFLLVDFRLTWMTSTGIRELYYYNKRDLYFILLFVTPAFVSHIITIWGHYYKADVLFQKSIAKVSTAAPKKRKGISKWDKHDPWLGYTGRYWALVALAFVLNLMWFIQPIAVYLPGGVKFLGLYGAITAYVAFGSGYAAMGCCGMLLLLILRRSMLQALGFTYADLLPMHRGMGLLFVFWSVLHTMCYILYYIHINHFWENFNFDGNTRGPQNLFALAALASLLGLAVTALECVRRNCYLLFITAHRVFTVITFVGTLMHFPYYMIWYYVLPSVCLYLADRFVPKFIQSISMAPEVECSFNKEADILTMVLSSRDRMEPLKPYYPGDYVNVEIPELSIVPHPFTIASYWAEDPYSMTLYIRTFQETRTSWTGALANMCCEREKDQDRPLLLKAKVDGVFGDRNHDYLSTKYMVIFSAGAAITTFMPLLKAMAAQIEAAAKVLDNPETIRVYLICTFRYESELYAYGDFMHRIIHDHRFNSWLHTQIYISRPDKGTPPVECPSGQCSSEFVCGRIENEENGDIVESVKVKVSESTSLLSYGFKGKSRYGAISTNCSGRNDRGKGCCMEADTAVSAGSSASSITLTSNTSPCAPEAQTIVTFAAAAADHDAIYRHRALPTFPAASSSIIATVHAKKDLVATTLILIVPMFIYVWARAIPWEGTYRGETHWCRTTIEHDQHMTNRCLWSYSMLPGFLHIISACVFGYLGLWVARSTNLFGRSDKRSIAKSKSTKRSNLSARDAYKNLLNGLSALDLEAAVDRSLLYDRRTSDGNNNSHRTTEVPKESIPFLRGRIQVNHHIQELKGMGIGLEDMNDNLVGQGGDVLVFGGGPDAFVNMIGESCKKAAWKVDYHRETWAP